MSTDNPTGVKPTTTTTTTESHDETPVRWTDWSQIQRKRNERIDERSDLVSHEKEIQWLREQRNISRAEACRQLRWEDVEVPEEAIR